MKLSDVGPSVVLLVLVDHVVEGSYRFGRNADFVLIGPGCIAVPIDVHGGDAIGLAQVDRPGCGYEPPLAAQRVLVSPSLAFVPGSFVWVALDVVTVVRLRPRLVSVVMVRVAVVGAPGIGRADGDIAGANRAGRAGNDSGAGC